MCITSDYSKYIDIQKYNESNYDSLQKKILYLNQFFSKYCFKLNNINPKIEIYDFILNCNDKLYFLQLKHLEPMPQIVNLTKNKLISKSQKNLSPIKIECQVKFCLKSEDLSTFKRALVQFQILEYNYPKNGKYLEKQSDVHEYKSNLK